MIILKEKSFSVVVAILLLFCISLIVNTSTIAVENEEPTTAQSSVGITFTDRESPIQDRPEVGDNANNNPDLGGGGNTSAGENQNGKSIFPQTGEKSTITLIAVGLLMVLLVSSYFCYKKYKNYGKKVKI